LIRKRSKAIKRRGVIIVSISVLLAASLTLWTHLAEREVHYTPKYAMADISNYLEHETLMEEEYGFLYRQTGVSPVGIDTLWESGRSREMLVAQQNYFARVSARCEQDFLLFREELTQPRQIILPILEDGDILITFNSHFLGWRNGHAAIVIDAVEGQTLEAITIGTDSEVRSVNGWGRYPSYAVLRLTGASEEERAQIADYAKEALVAIPYRLTAGLWDGIQTKGAKGTLLGTHCAHLVWYAYREFGYDLDSDGGLIVTPYDLYESPLLEVVQVYGMPIPS